MSNGIDETIMQPALRSLLSAIANASLYGDRHPQVTRLVESAHLQFNRILETTDEIKIVSLDGVLVINGEAQENSLFLSRLNSYLQHTAFSHISIQRGVSKEDIARTVNAISQGGNLSAPEQLTGVKLGSVALNSGDGGDRQIQSAAVTLSLPEMPAHELDRFMDLYDSAKQKKQLRISGISEIVSSFVTAFNTQGDSLLTMASLKEKDEYTFTHSTNVCILTIAQASALGIKGEMLRDFGVAAMLHDIGKMYIPEELITKKGGLTDEEFAIMQQHPALGARHLVATPGVPRLAVAVAFEHHLKYNGSGYPKTKNGIIPNLCSQMTMIADFFDALRTRRSYREPMELDTIASMMHEISGKDLHPTLTANFLYIIGKLAKSE